MYGAGAAIKIKSPGKVMKDSYESLYRKGVRNDALLCFRRDRDINRMASKIRDTMRNDVAVACWANRGVPVSNVLVVSNTL
jgi:hypothetical protein